MRSLALSCVIAVLVACAPDAPPSSPAAATTDLATDAPAAPATIAPAVADGPADAGDPATAPAAPPAPPLEPAPWSAPPLAADALPEHFLAQWRLADNRDTCAPIAPVDTSDRPDARPRPATFSGGWAVAYDEPGLRSAFGIAGAGVEASAAGDSIWPDSITWADGSVASYGLEGGDGPGHLAYLEVAGQGCVYNVWSKLGEAHLLDLLGRLRRVQPGATKPR